MNRTEAIDRKILAAVSRRGRGTVFSGTEFIALGQSAAVRQALSRLTRTGTFRRIGTALYHYPAINASLGGELPPSADVVAQALVRRTDSRIVASGALAANLLGLSKQVPAKRLYLTDGPSRSIAVGPYTLTFRHVSPRRMAAKGKISAVVFEALRYLKREQTTETVLENLRRNLPAEAKSELRRDLSHASVWMRPLVQRILAQEDN